MKELDEHDIILLLSGEYKPCIICKKLIHKLKNHKFQSRFYETISYFNCCPICNIFQPCEENRDEIEEIYGRKYIIRKHNNEYTFFLNDERFIDKPVIFNSREVVKLLSVKPPQYPE